MQAHIPCAFEKARVSDYIPLREKQSIKLQSFAWRVKLSRSLLKCIIWFKMSKNRRKTLLYPSLTYKTKNEWQGLYRNWLLRDSYTLHSALSEIVSLVNDTVYVFWLCSIIAGFHMTSLKFKLQNYWSSWYFTIMMYKSSWILVSIQILVPNGFLVLW